MSFPLLKKKKKYYQFLLVTEENIDSSSWCLRFKQTFLPYSPSTHYACPLLPITLLPGLWTLCLICHPLQSQTLKSILRSVSKSIVLQNYKTYMLK